MTEYTARCVACGQQFYVSTDRAAGTAQALVQALWRDHWATVHAAGGDGPWSVQRLRVLREEVEA